MSSPRGPRYLLQETKLARAQVGNEAEERKSNNCQITAGGRLLLTTILVGSYLLVP